MTSKSLIFGVLFGFVLSRIGATDYDAIAGMFKLTDLHLMGVIGGAVVLSALGFWLVRRSAGHSLNGEPIVLAQKPMKRGLVAGSLMFGVGWALSGTCPGTALAQLGEGRWAALATIGGILLGSYLVESRAARASVREPKLSRDAFDAPVAAK
jgi:uncharacterized membrane protein YedE/YeeE